MASDVPKVLISYSHDSPEHARRVLELAERLRVDGIDAQLDQYVAGTPAKGWPRWMDDQLDSADFVLAVCTETYHRRFLGREEPEKGKGADWEGSLITLELYDARSDTSKFVPVLFDPEDQHFIPRPLSGHTHYLLGRREMLKEEIVGTGAAADAEILAAARSLLENLKKQPGGQEIVQQTVAGNKNIFSGTGDIHIEGTQL